MAVRTAQEIIDSIKARIGDDVSDEALKILEDVTDTVSDYERRISESGDWERQYREMDATWRQRYRDRFDNNPRMPEEPTDIAEFVSGEVETVIEEPDEEPQTYEDLFKYE